MAGAEDLGKSRLACVGGGKISGRRRGGHDPGGSNLALTSIKYYMGLRNCRPDSEKQS